MAFENGGNNEQSPQAKKPLDFAKLVVDSHLTKEEKVIITEAYAADKEGLIAATKGNIKNFILKDYGAANMQSLGGFEGIITLQKTLGVKEDGSFGPETFGALIEYQKANGIAVDGVVGVETMGKLGISISGTTVEKSIKKTDEKLLKGKQQAPSDKVVSSPIPRENTSTAPSIAPSVAPIISKYARLVTSIEDQIKDTNKSKQENTGIIAGVGDWIGEKTGAYTTGKQIYEGSIENTKKTAKELHEKILRDLNNKSVSEGERQEIRTLISRLEKLAGAKLEDVSWGAAALNEFKNTFENVATLGESVGKAGEAVKHGMNWSADFNKNLYGKGLDMLPNSPLKDLMRMKLARDAGQAKGLGDALGGVLDLTGSILRLADTDYRNKFFSICGTLVNNVDKYGWDTVWTVFNKIGEKMDEVKNLPKDQQAELLGRIEGNIIGMLASGGAIGALGKARGAASAASEGLGVAAKAAQAAGNTQEAVRLGVAASEQAAKAMIYKIGAFALGGPAEEAIGATLSNSFRVISNTLRGGSSLSHKLKTVEQGIADFGEAIKREKNPENLKYLEEVKKALEAERLPLAKQAEGNPVGKTAEGETLKEKTPEKPIKKEFVTDGKESKRILQELMQYYHPDKTNYSRAEEITKELNRLRTEMKTGKEVRAELEAIAKDPEKFLNEKQTADVIGKGAENASKKAKEMFMNSIESLKKDFSEANLRGLAGKDATEFGEALLRKHTLEDITKLAETDLAAAQKAFAKFKENPTKFLNEKYPSPYMSPSKEAQEYARRAYEGAYKNEGENLRRGYRELYEKTMSEGQKPLSAEAIQKIGRMRENLNDIASILGEKFVALSIQIKEISNLLAGNVRENWGTITSKLDAFAESIRLSPEMGLNMKADISEKLRTIREKFFAKGGVKSPEIGLSYQQMAEGKGINIPRSDGTMTGVKDFRILGGKDDEFIRVIWKDGKTGEQMYKDIRREDFEVANSNLFGKKAANAESFRESNTREKPASRSQVEGELQPLDHRNISKRDMSDEASRLFDNPHLPKPEYRIQIDGTEFLLTGKLQSNGREYILGAVKVNGKYEPRFFYYSQSGGNWHCAPGIEGGGRFSKAEFLGTSYEKGTIVSPKLSEKFDSLKTNSVSEDISDTWLQDVGVLDKTKFGKKYGNEFRTEKIDGDALHHVNDLGRNASVDNILDTFRDIILPKGFNQSFPGGFRNGPAQMHKHLGPVDTVIGRTALNGEPIEVIFASAKDKPGLIWVEDIRFVNTKVNSHGIPERSINAGMLTAKPLEYTVQVPNSVNPHITGEGKIIAGDYVDMRPYMQENPLIEQFKRLNSTRRAA